MGSRRIHMVLKTTGLEYDDRVRKECESLVRLGADVGIVVLERDNVSGRRIAWENVRALSIGLTSRRLLPHRRGIPFKLLEFNVRALAAMLQDRPDVVWAHNQESALVVAAAVALRRLGVVERVVWDQHELPRDTVLGIPWLRKLWDWLAAACDSVIVANTSRRDFLRTDSREEGEVPFVVLENWADRTFGELPETVLPMEVAEWLKSRPYILLQGGAHPGRHFDKVATAVVEHLDADVGLIVVGGHSDTDVQQLRRRWGDRFDRQVWFTGWIPQMEIPAFIDHAQASLVLYEASSPNSLYCAPNRLYQAITRGVPVIVGANPPMAELVHEHGIGIILDGTGESPADIAAGIRSLLRAPGRFRQGLSRARETFLWENQDAEIARIIAAPPWTAD